MRGQVREPKGGLTEMMRFSFGLEWRIDLTDRKVEGSASERNDGKRKTVWIMVRGDREKGRGLRIKL